MDGVSTCTWWLPRWKRWWRRYFNIKEDSPGREDQGYFFMTEFSCGAPLVWTIGSTFLQFPFCHKFSTYPSLFGASSAISRGQFLLSFSPCVSTA